VKRCTGPATRPPDPVPAQHAYRRVSARPAAAWLVAELTQMLGIQAADAAAPSRPPRPTRRREPVSDTPSAETARTTAEPLTTEAVQEWLLEKVAHKLGVAPAEVDPEQYFDEFDLDSTEALVLSGELEDWLGFELETTALWYHPTIAQLSRYIAEKQAEHAA
jgi:acyl carrier protein